MDALREAANKVVTEKNQGSGAMNSATLTSGGCQDLHAAEGYQNRICQSVDQKEKKIHEMTSELENINHQCEVYRANLLAVLRDMKEQKLKLSVKLQNARLSLKE